MTLQYEVESLEQVPEGLREHYEEQNGRYVLRLEGAPQAPAPAGLVSALEKLKRERSELRERLRRYGDLDPEAAREALTRLAEAEQARQQGQDPALVRVQREYQQQLTQIREQLTALERERDETRRQLERREIEAAFDAAAQRHRVRPAYLDDVRLRAQHAAIRDGRVVLLGADGEPLLSRRTGEPLTPDEWLAEIAPQKPDWFEQASGGGARGGAGRGATETISRDDRAGFMRRIDEIATGKVRVV